MATTNHDRVGKALEALKAGLVPFVKRELTNLYRDEALAEAQKLLGPTTGLRADRPFEEWDAAVLLKVMWSGWNAVFRKTLGQAERTLVSELRSARDRWAHQEPFSTDDAYRALDSAVRLLTAVSAPEAAEVEKMKMELLRVRFDEQMRTEKRRSAGTAIETPADTQLKPWREVVSPHRDVASGRYQQAEFAADLWQVHLGEGSDEYRRPFEFFRRTYLTDSLTGLLTNAIRRLAGTGGDPVVQLQTNFGGGKTHSMLALYHLFSGEDPAKLAGLDGILKESGTKEKLPEVRRVVLVGNKISPGNPVSKPGGTVVRTLWGELAWQLGQAAGGQKEAEKAYRRIAADDARATSPGDALRELLNEYGPCLLLIDEWVAYARQLHEGGDLPGGSFETHFTFAQALTEAAKAARACLLVVSLPSSEASGSPHSGVEDVEVGGERGRAALQRLRNAIGRVESSWRPASAEEGFEIVRRRLFEPLIDRPQFVARDSTARAFFDLYRTHSDQFPPECGQADYEQRLKAAYPIHPEVFDRLYSDWSTLINFQRTRGVLRLMAAVIHSLWEKGDRNPLILPASVPIDDRPVQFELTRYLSENWVPVIEKDVDGPNALPLQIDRQVASLGKYAACRRVARTIYLGSAPTVGAAHQGIEDRRIQLGCVMPGEPATVFGDALRRLAAAATYLYQDGVRYWYSTQPTVTKLAEDRAEQLRRDPDKVAEELAERLRRDLHRRGSFSRIHRLPVGPHEVPDDLDTRLVVLSADHPYSRGAEGSAALIEGKRILELRSTAPRRFRNALVFLAADQARLEQDLYVALRRYLAWKSIVEEREGLNLSPHQLKQAEKQRDAAERTVEAQLPEAYHWLLVPHQKDSKTPMEWRPIRLAGQEPLAERASQKLQKEDQLRTVMGGTVLRHEIDAVPLWRGDERQHVSIQQILEDYASYPFLPRLADGAVLYRAIEDGLGLLTWETETFAYAESWDEEAGRLLGLRAGERRTIAPGDPGLLVKPEAARAQLDAEGVTMRAGATSAATGAGSGEAAGAEIAAGAEEKGAPETGPRRFHGTVTLDSARVGRDAGQIADEVISHLVGLVGSKVEVTLEIEAKIPDGAPDRVVRIVTENSRTLGFTSQGFEKE
ncbi:MAG TPA: Swt1 family HEPN domain-containing protein [Thermoanaerobaculia bacterium]|nr:Swt1 family HEPN domain-containing protein [Thermoanaerobaculia bacterium]